MTRVAPLLILLAGCATPTTGVLPQQDGMYTVTRQGAGAWVTPDSLKAAAIQEAQAFCEARGRRYRYLHSKETPAGAFGRWPESEVLFRCDPA